jgi:hypothetical protein
MFKCKISYNELTSYSPRIVEEIGEYLPGKEYSFP